jgi:cytoskeleton protein RodZ
MAGGTALPNPITPLPTTSEPAPTPAAAPDTTGAAPAASAAASPAPAAAPGPGEATLLIRYNENAWTQVKDASGQTILVTTGTPGGSQTVHGRPPLEVTLGNASETSLTWRGEPFDLAPHIKGNVARVRLP